MTEQTSDELVVGPVDYIVVEFAKDRELDGTAFPLLVDLVDRGIIRVLDLEFVRKDDDGSVVGVEIAELGFGGDLDVALFAEAATGLLDAPDIEEVGSVLEPGTVAAVLVYENHWAAPFATALRRNGAELVASGRIAAEDVLAALDAAEGK
ncbi:DUF6325 family protein [Gordonia sp. CPCC 205515]|uniref:DUF6325 family protein n=1 Tax=Gordonia sp. CPCC 205515 TaxID=3140791 RepID=UPI003AF3AE0F